MTSRRRAGGETERSLGKERRDSIGSGRNENPLLCDSPLHVPAVSTLKTIGRPSASKEPG